MRVAASLEAAWPRSSLRRCARIATTLATVHPAHGVAIVEAVSGDGVLGSMRVIAMLQHL